MGDKKIDSLAWQDIASTLLIIAAVILLARSQLVPRLAPSEVADTPRGGAYISAQLANASVGDKKTADVGLGLDGEKR